MPHAVLVPMLICALILVLMLRALMHAQAPTRDLARACAPRSDMAITVNIGPLNHHARTTGLAQMTASRPLLPGDCERANQVIELVRCAIEKYRDHSVALADGYRIFLPNVPQVIYHFTNSWYGFKAGFEFDPEHPTSLLYQKLPSGEYELIGAAFTAPARFSEDQLDKRIPLSIARWRRYENGWTVYVYPFEENFNSVWSVEPVARAS